MERVIEPLRNIVDLIRDAPTEALNDVTDFQSLTSDGHMNELMLGLASNAFEYNVQYKALERQRSAYITSTNVIIGSMSVLVVAFWVLVIVLIGYRIRNPNEEEQKAKQARRSKQSNEANREDDFKSTSSVVMMGAAFCMGVTLSAGVIHITHLIRQRQQAVNEKTMTAELKGGDASLRNLLTALRFDSDDMDDTVITGNVAMYAYYKSFVGNFGWKGDAKFSAMTSLNDFAGSVPVGEVQSLISNIKNAKSNLAVIYASIQTMDVMGGAELLRDSMAVVQDIMYKTGSTNLAASGSKSAAEDVSQTTVVEALIPKFITIPNLRPTDTAAGARAVTSMDRVACVKMCQDDPLCGACFQDDARKMCTLYTKLDGANAQADYQFGMTHDPLSKSHIMLKRAYGDTSTVSVSGNLGTGTLEAFKVPGADTCSAAADTGFFCGTYISDGQGARTYIGSAAAASLKFVPNSSDANGLQTVTLRRPLADVLETAVMRHMPYTLTVSKEELADALVKTGLDVTEEAVRGEITRILSGEYGGADGYRSVAAPYQAILLRASEMIKARTADAVETTGGKEGQLITYDTFRTKLINMSETEFEGLAKHLDRIRDATTGLWTSETTYNTQFTRATDTIRIRDQLVKYGIAISTFTLVAGLAWYLSKNGSEGVLSTIPLAILGSVPIILFFITMSNYNKRRQAYLDFNRTVSNGNGRRLMGLTKDACNQVKNSGFRTDQPSASQPLRITEDKTIFVQALYRRMVEMTQAYERCNNINLYANARVPLQLTDIAVSTLLLLVYLGCIIFIVAKFQLVERAQKMRWMIQAKSKLARYIPVPESQLLIYTDKTSIPEEITKFLTVAGLIVLVIGTILYSAHSSSAADLLKPGLFNSNYYAQKRCVAQ